MSAEILPFRRWRRFVGIEKVGADLFRARIFIGWHADRKFKPDVTCSQAQATERAMRTAKRMGIPAIVDRVKIVTGGGHAA